MAGPGAGVDTPGPEREVDPAHGTDHPTGGAILVGAPARAYRRRIALVQGERARIGLRGRAHRCAGRAHAAPGGDPARRRHQSWLAPEPRRRTHTTGDRKSVV